MLIYLKYCVCMLALFIMTSGTILAKDTGPKDFRFQFKNKTGTEEYQFSNKREKGLKYSNHLHHEYRKLSSGNIEKLSTLVGTLCQYPHFDSAKCEDYFKISCGLQMTKKCLTKKNTISFQQVLSQFIELSETGSQE